MKKNKMFRVASILTMLVFAMVVLGGCAAKKTGDGAGNLAGMGMVTKTDGMICVSDPATNMLSVYDEGTTAPVMTTPAWFLSVYKDELYYVSMETAALMRFVDGENDEVIVNDQCYYPQFADGMLYYINADDGLMYAMTEKDGKFIGRTCISETDGALVCQYANEHLYFYDNNETGLYYMDPKDPSTKKQLVSGKMTYINVTEDGYVYYKDINDENSMKLVRVTPAGERKVLAEGSFDYVNYYDGYVYYSNAALGSGGYIYRIAADGSTKPTALTSEWSTNITIIDGIIYYVGDGGSGLRVWKELSLSELEK